jgi:flagellar motor component MotA
LLKSCQKIVKKLSKVVQKLSKSCQKVVKKLSKSCHKKLLKSLKSEVVQKLKSKNLLRIENQQINESLKEWYTDTRNDGRIDEKRSYGDDDDESRHP